MRWSINFTNVNQFGQLFPSIDILHRTALFIFIYLFNCSNRSHQTHQPYALYILTLIAQSTVVYCTSVLSLADFTVLYCKNGTHRQKNSLLWRPSRLVPLVASRTDDIFTITISIRLSLNVRLWLVYNPTSSVLSSHHSNFTNCIHCADQLY